MIISCSVLVLTCCSTYLTVQLHNALLLSILYNTTRPSLPPAALRHSGWHKRRRDKDGVKIEDRDPKRRKVKATVMAIGKRERAELKMLGLGTKKEAEREREKAREREETKQRSLGAALDSRGTHIGQDGLPLALADAKQPPASGLLPLCAYSGALLTYHRSTALPQDYMRCLQAPHCCETRMLPDVDSLKDRMSLIAYDSGLAGGADDIAAVLGVQAIEVCCATLPPRCFGTDLGASQTHLTSMISSVISLIRSNRANGVQTSSSSQLDLLTAASEAASATPDQPSITVSDGKTTLPLDSVRAAELLAATDDSIIPDTPLELHDFSALFDISPGLLAQPHLAAVERLFAIPPPSDSEESELSSSDEEGDDEEGDVAMRETTTAATSSGGARKQPKLTRSSSIARPRSARSGSRSNSLNGSGREQYLIDPTAVAIPVGHPDVAHNPRTGTSSSSVNGGVNGEGGTATPNGTGTPQLSPKAVLLRQQLFPESENEQGSAGGVGAGAGAGAGAGDVSLQVPQSPSNNTSTDGGSESEDGAGHGHVTRGETAANGAARRRRGKLWEVVDSVRLLDGVL